MLKAVSGGWPQILASLKSLLETGEGEPLTWGLRPPPGIVTESAPSAGSVTQSWRNRGNRVRQ
jgi:hypothetical protein